MKKSFLFISCFAVAMAFSAVATAVPPPTTLALQSLVAVAEMSAPSQAVVFVATTTVDLAAFAQATLVARERMPADSLVAQAITVVVCGLGNTDVSLTKTGIHADQEAEAQSQVQTIT